jgi:alanine dehydrogenase
MDSTEITLRRTAAVSALAARYLARPEASSIAICGCGAQGRAQLEALTDVLPLERASAWDHDPGQAESFADEMRTELGIEVTGLTDLAAATDRCAVIVTATTARVPFLTRAMVAPGTFVVAVGADSPEKSELVPDVMRDATIVTDALEQCATFGDLHHAIEAGICTRAGVYAELGDLVSGRKRGRRTPGEITIFDSTGTAVADVASAARIYERAMTRSTGSSIDFGAD